MVVIVTKSAAIPTPGMGTRFPPQQMAA